MQPRVALFCTVQLEECYYEALNVNPSGPVPVKTLLLLEPQGLASKRGLLFLSSAGLVVLMSERTSSSTPEQDFWSLSTVLAFSMAL